MYVLAKPILSAFHTKIKSIKIDARAKTPLALTYLPLQLMKHTAVLIFSNENIGEFIYYLEGTALLPEPFKVIVDEAAIDIAHCKFIKSTSKFKFKKLKLRLLKLILFCRR